MRRGTATAHLYSGRPDPTWAVPARTVSRLLRIWKDLEPTALPPPCPPPLGYRGCRLSADRDQELEAFGGFVTLVSAGSPPTRRDPERNFERELLRSAPPDLLPEGLVPP